MRRIGVGLIEAGVVAAFVCLLAAAAVSGLRRVRGDARQAICLDNLFAQGQAMGMYQADNDEWFVSGTVSNAPETPRRDWGNAFTLYLPYHGYSGDPVNLWTRPRALGNRMAEVSAYQCPSHRDPAAALDYVSNATPLPFTARNRAASQGELQPFPAATWRPTLSLLVDVAGLRRFAPTDRFTLAADRLIFVTESHGSMAPVKDGLPGDLIRFHSVFLAIQLPYAGAPRIASEMRHPDGLNALFFDGAAGARTLDELDSGWPDAMRRRLLFFTRFAPRDTDEAESPSGQAGTIWTP